MQALAAAAIAAAAACAHTAAVAAAAFGPAAAACAHTAAVAAAAFGPVAAAVAAAAVAAAGSGKFYVGVMAQEVAQVAPEAVMRGRDGYLRVNYDKLGVKFQDYAHWRASGGQIPATRLH
jgi:hypothetical protein